MGSPTYLTVEPTAVDTTIEPTDWILSETNHNNNNSPQSLTPTSNPSPPSSPQPLHPNTHQTLHFEPESDSPPPLSQSPPHSPPPTTTTTLSEHPHEENVFSPEILQKCHKAITPASPAEPLAERMRPQNIDEVVGQDHLLGESSLLRSAIEWDHLPSIILWGPPGTGKTSIARAIVNSNSFSYRFVSLSAVTCGVKEVRNAVDEAKRLELNDHKKTVLFMDEVHRFNKSQQDSFLPVIEDGSVVFMAATTENPSFHLITPLLSRCRVLKLNPLNHFHIGLLLVRAVADLDKGLCKSLPQLGCMRVEMDDDGTDLDEGLCHSPPQLGFRRVEADEIEDSIDVDKGLCQSLPQLEFRRVEVDDDDIDLDKGLCHSPPQLGFTSVDEIDLDKGLCRSLPQLGFSRVEVDDDAIEFLSCNCDGDARVALNALEASAIAAAARSNSSGYVVRVTLEDVKEVLMCGHLTHSEKNGEEQNDLTVALLESMRGNDANAAIYWLAKMLEGGEQPLYIARKLIRFASEDVGLADPLALERAVVCFQSCHSLGMPECNVHLAECVTHLALAPKSTAVFKALEAAQRLVKDSIGQNEGVPLHLRNAPTKLMKEIGYGKGYIYTPDDPLARQSFLPASLQDYKFLHFPGEQDIIDEEPFGF